MFNNQEIQSKFKVIWNVTFIIMICNVHVYVFILKKNKKISTLVNKSLY